jgi:hypothetical protein
MPECSILSRAYYIINNRCSAKIQNTDLKNAWSTSVDQIDNSTNFFYYTQLSLVVKVKALAGNKDIQLLNN